LLQSASQPLGATVIIATQKCCHRCLTDVSKHRRCHAQQTKSEIKTGIITNKNRFHIIATTPSHINDNYFGLMILATYLVGHS
jgi:hypothetical protein